MLHLLHGCFQKVSTSLPVVDCYRHCMSLPAEHSLQVWYAVGFVNARTGLLRTLPVSHI